MSFLQAVVSLDDMWDCIPLPLEELALERYPLCEEKGTIQSPGFHLMDINCGIPEIEDALRKVTALDIRELNRLAGILANLSQESLTHFAADCRELKRPNLKGLTRMAEIAARPLVTMTLTEMCSGLDEAIVQDRKIMTACAEGLIQYATEQAKADPLAVSPRIPQLRSFLEQMMPYWGLDEGDAGIEDRLLDAFDRQTVEARSGEVVPQTTNQHKAGAAHGLYYYGNDMVSSQGEDGIKELSKCIELLMEITCAWDFESPITEDWVSELSSELERLNMSCDGIEMLPG